MNKWSVGMAMIGTFKKVIHYYTMLLYNRS